MVVAYMKSSATYFGICGIKCYFAVTVSNVNISEGLING